MGGAAVGRRTHGSLGAQFHPPLRRSLGGRRSPRGPGSCGPGTCAQQLWLTRAGRRPSAAWPAGTVQPPASAALSGGRGGHGAAGVVRTVDGDHVFWSRQQARDAAAIGGIAAFAGRRLLRHRRRADHDFAAGPRQRRAHQSRGEFSVLARRQTGVARYPRLRALAVAGGAARRVRTAAVGSDGAQHAVWRHHSGCRRIGLGGAGRRSSGNARAGAGDIHHRRACEHAPPHAVDHPAVVCLARVGGRAVVRSQRQPGAQPGSGAAGRGMGAFLDLCARAAAGCGACDRAAAPSDARSASRAGRTAVSFLMSAARHRALVLALLLVAAVWVATLAVDRPSASKPALAAPREFSGARAKLLLQRLVGDNVPHPLGSPANERMRERIVTLLLGLGLKPELQSGIMVCSRYGVCGVPTNILARIQGTDVGNERAVLLVAHYDSVAAGPGASDNGAGVATVLEIGRILQLLPPPRQSIILLLDDGEEPGLLGAQAFVQHHRWAASVTAAVNLDARGTSGPSLMFETGSANRWLMRLYSGAVSRPLTNSLYYAIYQRLPNDTDFSVFKAAGFQGFNFAFIGDVAHYHTPLDDAVHADADSLQQQGDNALATLLALANAGPGPPPSGEAVYFDLFGALLVRIPQTWVVPAALISVLLLLIAGARLLLLRLLSLRALLWGSLGLVAAVAVGATAAAALMALLRSLGAVSAGGAGAAVAHPWALEVGFAGLAFFITTLIGARLQRQAGFWGLWYSGALLYALLAAALARWLPGASYVALLPAIVALLALLPAMWPAIAPREASAWLSSAELAALALCVVTFVLVLP